jgi:crotonobetainyl-CoA:carnitine CoA-transferase CaiB-like acyl-CoA transferase
MSTSYAGPTASMYLADLGADVVKLERPETGDDARAWSPPAVDGASAWFASANRNKRSIALDLRSEGGRAVLRRLLAGADVFIENLNPAKLESLGLAPETTRERHPRLIYCAMSGVGLTGPSASPPRSPTSSPAWLRPWPSPPPQFASVRPARAN